MLVLDLSGSTGTPPSKLTQLKTAAKDTLAALDAADGATDQSSRATASGIVTYRGTTATGVAAVGAGYGALVTAIDGLPAPRVAAARTGPASRPPSSALASSSAEGQGHRADHGRPRRRLDDGREQFQRDYAAKSSGVRIVPFGLGAGADVSQANLTRAGPRRAVLLPGRHARPDRAGRRSSRTSAPPSPCPLNFTVSEAMGSTFSAAPVSSTGRYRRHDRPRLAPVDWPR